MIEDVYLNLDREMDNDASPMPDGLDLGEDAYSPYDYDDEVLNVGMIFTEGSVFDGR